MAQHAPRQVPRVLVIGAGVSGLTSALCLRRRGMDVTVVADRFAPDITSVVAGALWEWPPAVCGYHRAIDSLERSKNWCATSYRIFGELASDGDTGVFVRPVTYYFHRPVEEDPRELRKMTELRGHVDGFRHSPALVADNGVDPALGLRDAYSHLAPMVDTDAYLHWLMRRVEGSGCTVRHGRVAGDLREEESRLLEEFGLDAVVNCTGLGALELTDDRLYPLRGALVRVHNDGRAHPPVTGAHCMTYQGARGEQDMVFIVPRGRDMLLLGGLVEPHEWDLGIGLDTYQPVRQMFERCVSFLSVLESARIDAREPVRAGLRPFREDGVRVEREPGSRIVHNYGHGGSGVTFSWGCAAEVVTLVEEVVGGGPADAQPRPGQPVALSPVA